MAAKIDPLSDATPSVRGRAAAKALLDALTIISRIIAPEIPGRCSDSTDGLTVVAIEGEVDARDLATPAHELEHVRTPATFSADRRHLAVMLAR
jgi:hypothetical protein